MAQSNVLTTEGPLTQRLKSASNSAVSCPASGNTTLLQFKCEHLERIIVQISVATQALDAFLIQTKSVDEASFVTLYSAATDYTTLPAGGLLVGTSGDLTTTAAGGSGWFIMDVRGLHSVKILASAAVNNADVTIYMGGQ